MNRKMVSGLGSSLGAVTAVVALLLLANPASAQFQSPIQVPNWVQGRAGPNPSTWYVFPSATGPAYNSTTGGPYLPPSRPTIAPVYGPSGVINGGPTTTTVVGWNGGRYTVSGPAFSLAGGTMSRPTYIHRRPATYALATSRTPTSRPTHINRR